MKFCEITPLTSVENLDICRTFFFRDTYDGNGDKSGHIRVYKFGQGSINYSINAAIFPLLDSLEVDFDTKTILL